MRAADRRGLLRAPVTVALQTAITQKKGKTLSRTSLHHPRRTPPRFESRLAPLLRRGQGLRTVGVDSRSSSWWNGDRQTSPGRARRQSASRAAARDDPLSQAIACKICSTRATRIASASLPLFRDCYFKIKCLTANPALGLPCVFRAVLSIIRRCYVVRCLVVILVRSVLCGRCCAVFIVVRSVLCDLHRCAVGVLRSVLCGRCCVRSGAPNF